MGSMTAADALVVVFRSLPADEQEDAFRRLSEERALRESGAMSDIERLLASLRRVVEHTGAGLDISPGVYRRGRIELREAGEEVAEVNQLIRFFGSWVAAKEALGMAATTTPLRVDARFRHRRVGKVWRYDETMLRDTLVRATADIGHPPLISEFDWWRQRELERARALGNDALHLPSATPYRRRYGTWEAALLHFGFTPDQVAERLAQQ